MYCHQFSCPFIHLSEFFAYNWNDTEYLTRGTTQMMRFLLQNLVSRSSSEVLFSYFFFYLCLFDCVCFQYSQVRVIFLLSKYSDSFLISQFYSFCCFSLSTFHYQHGTFFQARFHSYILAVYSYYSNEHLWFFLIFCK